MKEKSSHFKPYTIEVFPGPMFSEKTGKLLRRISPLRFDPRNYTYIGIKPKIDSRSFNSRSFEDFINWNYLKSSAEIIPLVRHYDLIAVDEASFFDGGLVQVISKLQEMGKNIVISGLDKDFRGEPFPVMEKLMSISQVLDKCSSICSKCGDAAYYTQRLINGKPAKYNSPIISIQKDKGKETYEPRCFIHHEVPGKPKN